MQLIVFEIKHFLLQFVVRGMQLRDALEIALVTLPRFETNPAKLISADTSHQDAAFILFD